MRDRVLLTLLVIQSLLLTVLVGERLVTPAMPQMPSAASSPPGRAPPRDQGRHPQAPTRVMADWSTSSELKVSPSGGTRRTDPGATALRRPSHARYAMPIAPAHPVVRQLVGMCLLAACARDTHLNARLRHARRSISAGETDTWGEHTLEVGGRTRRYIVRLPSGYDRRATWPWSMPHSNGSGPAWDLRAPRSRFDPSLPTTPSW